MGKTPAGIVAGLCTFAVVRPMWLHIDGRRQRIWLAYLGRGQYYPTAVCALKRPILDDGVLNLRVFSARSRFFRLRIMGRFSLAVLRSPPRSLRALRARWRFPLRGNPSIWLLMVR